MRFIALLLIALASHAAAQPLPDLKGAGVAVLGITFQNAVRPAASAGKLGILVNPSQFALDLNGNPIRKGYAFSEDVSNSGALIVARLEPGEYTITTIAGAVRRPAFGFHPLDYNVDAKFQVKAGAVTYIGSLDLVNVKIEDLPHQQQSGPAAPILDAMDTGIANGTLAIRLLDRYEAEVALLRRLRPSWADVAVERAPMQSIVSKRPLRSNLPHTVVKLTAE